MDASELQSNKITVLNGQVILYQPVGGFRTSLDSVLLAHFCQAKQQDAVLDAGCGVGGASFCLTHRLKNISLTGVDWSQEYLSLARKNADLNRVRERTNWVLSDIREYNEGPKPIYNHVIINPPFYEADSHTASPDFLRAQALGHQDANLQIEDWIHAAHRLVKNFGSITLIYPANGLSRILRSFGVRWGGVEVIPIYPKVGKEAKRILVRARKNRKTPCRILPPLVLHQTDGKYTDDADVILRGNQLKD